MKFNQLNDAVPIELGQRFQSFVSGEQDPDRYALKYFVDDPKGSVYGHVVFGSKAQGVCCWVKGYPAMTAQYTTRFLVPVPILKEVLFIAWIKEREESKIVLKCELIDADEKRYAEGKGLFILQDISTFEKMRQAGPDLNNAGPGFASIKSGNKE